MGVTGWAWVGLAFLNARLARCMNRSGIDWLVISLFIGPLATLLIRCWPPVPQSGPVHWTSGQLASGGAVALIGALFWAWAAIALSLGPSWFTLCALYLAAAGVFAWLLMSGRSN